jgi:GLPGLI family protein
MKIVSLLLMILIVSDLCGQSFEIHYVKRKMSSETAGPAKLTEAFEAHRAYFEDSSSFVYFKMVFNGIINMYYPLYEVRDTTLMVGGMNLKINKDSDREYYLFQDFKKNIHISRGSVLGKTYCISDTIPVWDWDILEDVKHIAGYECKKAITYESGRKIIVWFTEDIPLPLGPRQYGGLPGLILRLESGKTVEEAFSIIILNQTPELTAPEFAESPLRWEAFYKKFGSFRETDIRKMP